MTNINHDYIFFADDWGGIPTSTMHLADQIAKKHRVFWVNIYTRLPKVTEFSKAVQNSDPAKIPASGTNETDGDTFNRFRNTAADSVLCQADENT
ncbi:MAG: hypothetical protein LBN39_04655 [Planctomycetaceae bacterium]|jgi:hypothetical protein|nr:hypothetical protein [Planctomycetaceae bacterium]